MPTLLHDGRFTALPTHYAQRVIPWWPVAVLGGTDVAGVDAGGVAEVAGEEAGGDAKVGAWVPGSRSAWSVELPVAVSIVSTPVRISVCR